MIPSIQSVSFIGAGNVATHLALRLFASGIRVNEVWSRHLKNAEVLSKSVHANICSHVNDLQEVDLVIIAVSDDAIVDVLSHLPAGTKAVVHTSGGLDLKILGNVFFNTGVLYPLQTFNKNEGVDWNEIPVCIEASNGDFLSVLNELALEISPKVSLLNSEERNKLHVAAVIVNNFTNYLYSEAFSYLQTNHVSFELLLPLIHHTVKKLDHSDPFERQTGPAKRNDLKVMKKHMELLTSNPDLSFLYDNLSKLIIKKAGN